MTTEVRGMGNAVRKSRTDRQTDVEREKNEMYGAKTISDVDASEPVKV